jgi:NADP-dependent 3-hydroxy acid dehydrogenase YdfG
MRTEKCSPVALITGGSAGIGAACVRKFLAAGWNVSVLALPDSNMNWLNDIGVVTTAGDVTSEWARESAVQRTLSAYGRIDLLLNSAGVGLYATPSETSLALFSRLLDVNVLAPLALAQLVIPVMLDQKSGMIATMGSVAGNIALPWAAAYSASKAALHSIHDALRIELRRTTIHLINVCPGIVDTEFRKNVLDGQPPQMVREIRFIVSPDVVANAVFRAVEVRRRTVYLPAVGWLFSTLGRMAPWVMDLYLSRLLHSPSINRLKCDAGESTNSWPRSR